MPLSFQRQTSFQNVPEQEVATFDFNGGLVTDAHETKLKENQSPDLANVLFNDTGSIKTIDGYIRYNSSVVGSSSNQSNTGSSTGSVSLMSLQDRVAQTFTVGADASTTRVSLWLAMASSGEEQLVRLEVWSTDTTPDTPIYESKILLVSGTSETEYQFHFREPLELSASTSYALVLRAYPHGDSETVRTVVAHRTGSSYANGMVYTSANNGNTWADDSSIDLKFTLYTGGTTPGSGLIRYYPPVGVLPQLLAKFGSSLYVGNDNTGALTSIYSSFHATNFIDYTHTNGTMLIVDRDGAIRKYRGNTSSNYSTGTLSVTSGSATVTGSGTTWVSGMAGQYIQLPDGKWYLITACSSNTSITIETKYPASSTSGQSYSISSVGSVLGNINSSSATYPSPDYIENHKNRIWTLKGDELRFSALDTTVSGEHFNDWSSDNNAGVIIIPSGKGDSGTGLYSLGNALFIFQRHSIWGLYGDSPANFELRNITNEIGMIDKRTLVEWNDVVVFLSDAGVYGFDGSNLKSFSDQLIDSTINSWANKTTPVATLWDNKYLIANTASGHNYNDEAYYYDLNRGVWGKIEGISANSFSRWVGGSDSGEVYFQSSNQGSIYKWGAGHNFDGYPIETRYSTPSLGYGAGVNDKAAKKFYIQQLSQGNWSMSVTMYADVNGVQTQGSDISLGASGLVWGESNWDEESWVTEDGILTSRIAEFQGIAKYFKFVLSQTGYDEGIEVLAIVATSRLRRLR